MKILLQEYRVIFAFCILYQNLHFYNIKYRVIRGLTK